VIGLLEQVTGKEAALILNKVVRGREPPSLTPIVAGMDKV
jgi:hypothetical protein